MNGFTVFLLAYAALCLALAGYNLYLESKDDKK